MKILYVTSGNGEDYERDVLFHGLRELLGPDAVDVNRIASLYEQSDNAKHCMYGRGYTVYANLSDITVDRNEILNKIRSKVFDVVIYGSVYRCKEYLAEVLRHYPRSRVAFVDGEDRTSMTWALLGKGVYFKRELLQPLPPFLHPIHFAVPEIKFVSETVLNRNLRNKRWLFAPCDPRDRSTYVFMSECAYYQQYQESHFGITMKKNGWDCMRHHEIMAQGAAPYFLHLEDCPHWTMHRMPKRQLLELRELVSTDMPEFPPNRQARYEELMKEVFKIYRHSFTTIGLARYVLEVMAESKEIDRINSRHLEVGLRRMRCYFKDRWGI